MKIQLKVAIVIGVIALFTVGGLVAYQEKIQRQIELDLTHLIDLPYEVLGIQEVEQKECYDVYLSGDLDYTNEILLSTKIQKEVISHYRAKNAIINLHLYDKSTVEVDEGVNLNEAAYQYTLQTTGSNVIKYLPLAFKGIEGNVTTSSDWSIQDSTYNKDKELTFTTHLKKNLSNEAIFSTIKGISDEMSRHNGHVAVKQSIPISEEQIFYHDSHYPDYLIEEIVLVGRGALTEGVGE